jgi:TonB family protein
MSTGRAPCFVRLRTALLACACLLAAGAHAPPQAQPGRSRVADVRAVQEALSEGRMLLMGKKYAEAVASFRGVAARFPEDPSVWFHLGVAHRNAGDYEEAGEAFRRALKSKFTAGFGSWRAEYAYALLLSGREREATDEARRAFGKRLATTERHYVSALLRLSTEFPEEGALAKALAEAEAAVGADPNLAPGYLLKYLALVRLSGAGPSPAGSESARRLEDAAASLERFLALDPAADANALWREQLSAARAHAEILREPESARTAFWAKEMSEKAVIRSRPEPLYTREGRRAQTTGSVKVRLVLGADGTVQHVLVLKPLPNGLTEQSLQAARAIQFEPGRRDGRPASQFAVIEYNFNIY